jgi:ferredoxin
MNLTNECVWRNVTSPMADINLRTAGNVPGAYYVDDSCIDCDRCRSEAPDFFQRDDATGLTIVYRQPETSAEISLAEDALEGCPTDSIGRDGAAHGQG